MGNPQPVVLVKKLLVKELKTLKDAHLKVLLSDGKNYIEGLMWRQTSHPALAIGNTVDVAARPDSNSYRGATTLQLTLQAAEISRN